MNIVGRISRMLFAGYGLVVFVVALLLVVPCYLVVFTCFSRNLAPHIAHRISRLWGGSLLAAYFIRFDCAKSNVPDQNKTYVFVANHRSMIDIPAYALSCRNTFRFLAKSELTRIPLFGFIVSRLYVTVNRSSKADRSRSMEAMRQSIDNGISVFICPEGTRNRTSKPLLDFKDGAFRLAIVTQTPVAVLTLLGTDRLLDPARPAELRPGRFYGIWSQPIETAGMTESDLPRLKQRAFDLMMESLNKSRDQTPAPRPGGTISSSARLQS